MRTRWKHRAPAVTVRRPRPVQAPADTGAAAAAAMSEVGARLAALDARILGYDKHLGHAHATMIGDALESRMERRELSTRVANLGASSTAAANLVKTVIDNVMAHHEARDAAIANLIDVVADLVVKVDGIACAEADLP